MVKDELIAQEMSPKKLQGPNEPILLIHYHVYEGAKLLFDELPADIKTWLPWKRSAKCNYLAPL